MLKSLILTKNNFSNSDAISSRTDENGIVVELSDIFIINYIKLLLWDLDNRSYSYVVEVSVEKNFWECVVDHSNYHCRSGQHLYFEQQPVKFIRITGTHNTVGLVKNSINHRVNEKKSSFR